MRPQLAARLHYARRRLAHLRPVTVPARHREHSMIFSADDDTGPSERLLDVSLEAAAHARATSLADLSSRIEEGPAWPDIWPGEHYRLLAGLVRALKPRTVVEIGTATGLSALAMYQELPSDGRLVTFDLIPWADYPGSVMREADFADGRLMQELYDLSTQPPGAHAPLLETADLIFIDAAKDGRQERRFLRLLEATPLRRDPIVVFDDIRVWNMLEIWREVRRPKLDITSFGHWSGTGLVDFAASAARPAQWSGAR
jgi:predicted O-methyltransferase YrrM